MLVIDCEGEAERLMVKAIIVKSLPKAYEEQTPGEYLK